MESRLHSKVAPASFAVNENEAEVDVEDEGAFVMVVSGGTVSTVQV